MSAGYEYNYTLERQRRREIYLSRVESKTREFLNKYQNILNDVQMQGLNQYVDYDYNNYRNQLNTAFQCLSSDPERARDISQSIGKLIGALPKRAKERRRVYNQQEKQRRIHNEQQERQRQQQIQKMKRQQESLNKLKNTIQGFIEKYEKTLNNIKSQELDQYITAEYNQALDELNKIKQQLKTNPEYAKELSMSLGEWINTLPKQAQANKTQDIKLQKEKEEAERKRQLFLEEQREKVEQRIQQEFNHMIDEVILNLHDPVLRDYALDDLTSLVESYKELKVNSSNIDEIKNKFQEQSAKIIQQAQSKADEFNEKYFKKIDTQINQESLLEKVKEEKENIKKIKTDDPSKLEEIMNKLTSKEKDIQNGLVDENTDRFLDDISNEILEEEVNEEYRRHTVKSIFEILNKLGFKPASPKKVGDEVKLYAKRINGNEFEASIKANGTMMSHFNGYDYMACKDDINSLEQELQSCYGIELNKTKTIWENPDRIQKNAKPISELQRKG
jgi:hypothetical protein